MIRYIPKAEAKHVTLSNRKGYDPEIKEEYLPYIANLPVDSVGVLDTDVSFKASQGRTYNNKPRTVETRLRKYALMLKVSLHVKTIGNIVYFWT